MDIGEEKLELHYYVAEYERAFTFLKPAGAEKMIIFTGTAL